MKDIINSLIGKDIFQGKEIIPNQIPFSKELIKYCEMNSCGKYNTCWTCPPAVGDFESLRKLYTSYKKAFVANVAYKLEDPFDWEGMNNAYKKNDILAYRVIKEFKKTGKEYNLLKAGSCDLCKKCTYPDEPCRHIDMAFPTLEACGINVMNLAKNFGMTYYAGPNTVTYFMIFFYN